MVKKLVFKKFLNFLKQLQLLKVLCSTYHPVLSFDHPFESKELTVSGALTGLKLYIWGTLY